MIDLRYAVYWCIGFGVVGAATSTCAADPAHSVSIPVVVRSATAANPVTTVVPNGLARPTGPTTPSGKLPQYQLERDPREFASKATDTESGSAPDVLFCQLQLPQRSILLEITVTVDSRPYAQVRQARIEQALRELAAPHSDDASLPVSAVVATTTTPLPVPASVDALSQHLRRYAAATGRDLSESEVAWLLTHTLDGPICLWLNDHFQQVRGEQRPEFLVLDRDGDGVIAAEELAQAVETLLRCDVNRNEMIEWKEIAAAAQRSDHRPATHEVRSVMTPVTDHRAAPDLRLSVQFDRVEPSRSRLIVTAVSNDLKTAVANATTGPSGLTLNVLGTPIIFQALQSDDLETDQLSLGAIRDGYPWLPELDSYDDGRITLRELRDVVPRLTRFDTNRDGQLTVDEAVAPLRVCLAWGPVVHRELANLRQVGLPPESWNRTAPEWFARMDRNRDRDLTRGEFPGTDEQFAAMDHDQDTLISVDEATQYETTNTNTRSPEATDKPTSAPVPADSPE